ncbi:MAG: hypothetical protein ACI9J2_001526 [Saprospiraceae bacterium]|jgi:hypothetical protein
MFKKILTAVFALTLTFILASCSTEDSISDSGADSSAMSDGGADSAQYAGTYSGTLTLTYSGSGIPEKDDTLDMVLVIAADGTVKLTGDDIDVNGVISANSVSIDIKIIQKESGTSCKGTASIRGTVSGENITGPVTGSAECKILLVDSKKATLTGTISLVKQ